MPVVPSSQMTDWVAHPVPNSINVQKENTKPPARKMFLLIFVFDIIQPFQGVAEERLRNHNFIIPCPGKISSGKCRKIKGKHPLSR